MENPLTNLSQRPVTLTGQYVRLEPLAKHHASDLAQLVDEPKIWRWFTVELKGLSDVKTWIDNTLKLQEAGQILPFAIVEKSSGRAIGSTRYLDISSYDRALEIGFTWLGKPYWRTAINTNCKYLLLQYAFEQLDCVRVQLKADRRNERSRTAILGIGASFEGILRQHKLMRDGTFRDSAYYSILDNEWPTIKTRLAARLQQPQLVLG